MAEPPTQEPGSTPQQADTIAPGVWVILKGLKSRADLNGADAKVIEWVEDVGRWAVKVLGSNEGIRVKADNIEVPKEEHKKPQDNEEEEVDEGEEGEEGEDEEDEEDDESDGSDVVDLDVDDEAAVTIDIHHEPDERLGMDFSGEDDLTITHVVKGSPAHRAGGRRLTGRRVSHINGIEVTTLADAAAAMAKNNPVRVQVEPIEVVRVPEVADPPKEVRFKIPAFAPLNPNMPITFRVKDNTMFYEVSGKPRPPLRSIRFDLFGQHFSRELSFPSLGTTMWIPPESFLDTISALRAMADTTGVKHNLPKAIRKTEMEEVEEAEATLAAEREEKKKKKGRKEKPVKRPTAAAGQGQGRKRRKVG